MKLYTELAEYYFAIENYNRNINNDITLIRNLAKDLNRPALLDLGCGTGEHLDKLSALDFECTGIDSNKSMLDIARIRFPNKIRFIQQDMRSLEFKEEFNIVICFYGSFNYLITENEIDSTLSGVWNSLKSGGIGIFEIWNAQPFKKIKEKPLESVSKTKYSATTIERIRGFKLLESQNMSIVKVDYKYNVSANNLTKKIINDTHIMRVFTKKEIGKFLKGNRFNDIVFYANASLDPYSDISGRMVVNFKK